MAMSGGIQDRPYTKSQLGATIDDLDRITENYQDEFCMSGECLK